ncbi:MAG: c-type cytochrome biogenesis protein CcsB [Sphaerochaetaceae bacterium]|jgi:cytochrome c-type biogenesis protein CcsB|nr:c-type cytochrome biogenesis protein CcsB [Sphaerochaetaceae bacterium]MDD3941083.1 c-type cytochrome biogenesis protein CcsB [Sphaerochaetaceae bacterium]MDX9939968.1 c-type cytochrome biogenesis protein CcsB [Sphaerochaetaceae bacterium]
MDKFQNIENITFTIAFILYMVSAITHLFLVTKLAKKVEPIAILTALAGLVLHTAAMVARTAGANRLPFSNQYEFALSFAWGIVLSFLILYRIYRFGAIGAFVMPLAILVMGYASLQSKAVRPLMPALQSHWLTFHVGTAILSYGAFALACGISIIYLIDAKRTGDHRILKDPEVSDMLTYRVIVFGLLMLTVVIISGAIWAQKAWSRYWAWDPKETWSLITWIIYAIYLHLRLRRNWRGKSAAWFSIIGFISVLFTFVGVNILLPSIHSYAT